MVHAVIGAITGLIVGLAFFAALERQVDRWIAGGWSSRILVWHVARLVLAIAAFAWVAHLGGTALLAALSGFVVARRLMVPGLPQ